MKWNNKYIKLMLLLLLLLSVGWTVKVDSLLDSSRFPPCDFSASLWLKADTDVDTNNNGRVNRWNDQIQNNDATPTASNRRPRLNNNVINFNPAIDFDGSNDFLQGAAGGSNASLFLVVLPDQNISNTTFPQTPFTTSTTVPASDVYFFSFGSVTAAFLDEVVTHGIGNSTEYRSALLGNTVIPDNPQLYSTSHNQVTGNAAIYLDGTRIDNAESGNFLNAQGNRPYRIGGNMYIFGGTYYSGHIAEVITFSNDVSLADRYRMESYLGIKYGITLAHAYFSSSNQETYNEPAYSSHITAIGRDDCMELNQKQSKNTAPGSIITMGLGTIATDNSTNPNSFSADESFLFWGHDNDDNGTIEEVSAELPSLILTRLDREWKIRNRNSVGAVDVEFDLSGISLSGSTTDDFCLLVDEDGDGDFTTGTIQRIPADSWSSSVLSFDDITFEDDVVITIATTKTANDPPVLSDSTVDYETCPNGDSLLIAENMMVQDVNNDALTASITLGGVTDNDDIIGVDLTGMAGVSSQFVYPTLTITGINSPTQMQSVLHTLFIQSTSLLSGIRTVSISVNDGISASNIIVKNIEIDELLSFCCHADAPILDK